MVSNLWVNFLHVCVRLGKDILILDKASDHQLLLNNNELPTDLDYPEGDPI